MSLHDLPDFDGATYSRALDHERLGEQLLRVGRVMADGAWHTLREIGDRTGDPEASVSARLRDLRKRKFGGHSVQRQRLARGLWRYRLVREDLAGEWRPIPPAPAAPPPLVVRDEEPIDIFEMAP
jgi:hypothetical protein